MSPRTLSLLNRISFHLHCEASQFSLHTPRISFPELRPPAVSSTNQGSPHDTLGVNLDQVDSLTQKSKASPPYMSMLQMDWNSRLDPWLNSWEVADTSGPHLSWKVKLRHPGPCWKRVLGGQEGQPRSSQCCPQCITPHHTTQPWLHVSNFYGIPSSLLFFSYMIQFWD